MVSNDDFKNMKNQFLYRHSIKLFFLLLVFTCMESICAQNVEYEVYFDWLENKYPHYGIGSAFFKIKGSSYEDAVCMPDVDHIDSDVYLLYNIDYMPTDLYFYIDEYSCCEIENPEDVFHHEDNYLAHVTIEDLKKSNFDLYTETIFPFQGTDDAWHIKMTPIIFEISCKDKIRCSDGDLSLCLGKEEVLGTVNFVVGKVGTSEVTNIEVSEFYSRNDSTFALVSGADLPDASWFDKELDVYVDPISGDGEYHYNPSNTITGIFFLNKPSLNISVSEVKCSDQNPAITLSGFPVNKKDIDLNVTLSKLNTSQLYSGQPVDTKVNGINYYWDNKVTKSVTVENGNTTYSLGEGNLPSSFLENGVYGIEVKYNDSSISSLCSTKKYYTIQRPTELLLSLSTDSYHDNELNIDYNIKKPDGSGHIKANVTGATYPYALTSVVGGQNSWTENTSSEYDINDIALDNGLTSQTFTVSVNDNNSCGEKSETITLSRPSPLTISTSGGIQNVTCNGGNNGSISFTIAGGISPFNVTLMKGAAIEQELNDVGRTIQKIEGLYSSKDYTIKVVDSQNNTKEQTGIIISQPTALSASVLVNDVNCKGGSDGTITINTSGGTSPYQYGKTIYSYGTTNVLENYSHGTYTVFVKDSNGCTDEVNNVEIEQPSELQITNVTTTPATCELSDGDVSFYVSGGWSDDYPYTISLKKNFVIVETKTIESNITNPVSFNGLSADEGYSITVSNGSGCTLSSSSFSISSNNPMSIEASIPTGASCDEVRNGVVLFTVSGGIENYAISEGTYDSYTSDVFTINNCQSGIDYKLVIEDSRGCIASDNIVMTTRSDKTAFVGDLISNNATCEMVGDGSIDFELTGGIGGYTYFLNGVEKKPVDEGSNKFKFEGLESNVVYNVLVKDDSECEIQKSITVNTNPNPIDALSIAQSETSCSGKSDGAITISTSPTSGLTYQLVNTGASNNTGEFINLIDGNYDIKVIDDKGCYREQSDYTLNTKGHSPNPSNKFTEYLACETADNAEMTIELSAYDDDPAMVYDITLKDSNDQIKASVDDALSLSVTNMSNQTYSLSVEDQNGCSFDTTLSVPILTEDERVRVDVIQQISASCETASNGIIDVKASGSISGTNYYFNINTVSNHDSTSLGSDSYRFNSLPWGATCTISVTDDFECSYTTPETYTINAIPDANQFSIQSVQITDASCIGFSDGEVLPITQNQDLSIDTKFNLAIEKANGTEYVSFDNGQSQVGANEDIAGLSEGLYKIYLTDDNNCSSEYSFEIEQPKPVKFTFDNNLIVEKGDKTGFLECNIIEGGNSTFYWVLDGAAPVAVGSPGTIRVEELKDGDYTLKLQDEKGCNYDGFTEGWYTHIFNIEEPADTLKMVCSVDSVQCYGQNNGGIEWQATGGWGDYKYYFTQNGTETEDNDGSKATLTAGDYSVRIVDKEGAERTKDITVYQPQLFTISNVSVDQIINASCPGYNNGSAELQVNNGILLPDETLKFWAQKEGSSTKIMEQFGTRDDLFEGLTAGNYYLYASDRNGCETRSNLIEVTEPTPPEISLDYNYIKEKDSNTGFINATIKNGNENFYYQWIKELDQSVVAEGKTVSFSSIDKLYDGDYTLLVKDTAECIYEGTDAWMVRNITIKEPDAKLSLTVDTNVAASCNGLSDGYFTVSGVGGWGTNYLYGLSDDVNQMSTEPLFDNLVAGDYNIYVKDTADVVYSEVVTITQPEVLTAKVDSTKDVNCYDEDNGAIYLSAKGGNLSYLVSLDNINWIEGTDSVGLISDTYNVYLKDTLDCTISLGEVDIAQPSDIYLKNSDVRISKCGQNSGRIEVEIDGGTPDYTYYWQNDKLDSDEYTEAIADSVFAGRYALTVTDQHQCEKQYEFYVSDLTDLAFDTIYTNEVSCWEYADGTAELVAKNGTAPYYYSWDSKLSQTSSAYNTGIATGTYMAGLSDSEGCLVYKEFFVGTPDSIGYEINSLKDPLCIGGLKGTIDLQATGGTPDYSYQWSTGASTNKISNLDPGEYALTLTDAHNCVNTFDFALDYLRTIKPLLGNDTTICHYQTLNINPGIFSNYDWSSIMGFKSRTQSPDINDPDTYYLTITDADNCIGKDTLNVDVSYINISDIEIKDVTCNGDADGNATIAYTAGIGNHKISWPTGVGNMQWANLSGGDYSVTINDEVGCEDTKTFSVYEPDPLSLETQRLVDPYCFGVPDGQIKVMGQGGRGDYQYLWTNGETDRSITKLDTGYYHLTYWDKMNCEDTESFELAYQTAIYPKLGDDVTICDGNDYFLYPGEYIEYKWSTDASSYTSSDTAIVTGIPGEYYVEVQNDEYCIGRDTVEIFWRDTDINPSFLAASTVEVGDTVYMAEVSQPIPDSFNWVIGGNYQVVEQGTYHINVVFNEPGLFDVGIDAFLDGCLAQERKKILVMEKGETGDDGTNSSTEQLKVLSFVASPNPADSHFTASVELSEALPVTFYLVDISNGDIIEKRESKGLDNYTEAFTVPVAKSVLLLFIVVENERHSLKIIAGE